MRLVIHLLKRYCNSTPLPKEQRAFDTFSRAVTNNSAQLAQTWKVFHQSPSFEKAAARNQQEW